MEVQNTCRSTLSQFKYRPRSIYAIKHFSDALVYVVGRSGEVLFS